MAGANDFDITPASEIELKEIIYDWNDRIPRGMLTICAGRQGGGKSTVMSDIIAHYTRDLGVTAILSNQEDAETVQRARLEAAGADLSKVFTPAMGYRFPEDVNLLALHIEKQDAKIAIFDSANQHLSVPVGNDQAVRQALTPLTKLAEQTGCAIVFVTHVVKHVAKSAHPLTAISGSGAGLSAAARSVFFVGPNPDNLAERVCVWVKDQYRPMPLGIGFEIEVYDVEDEDTKVHQLSQRLIKTADDLDIDPLALLAGKAKDDGEGGPRADKRAVAAEWLTIYLSTGKQPNKQLRDDAAKAGLAWATIRRAADDLQIEKSRVGFSKNSAVYWALPMGHPALLEAEEGLEDDGSVAADFIGPLRDGQVRASGVVVEEGEEVVLSEEDEASLTDDDIAKLLGGE